MIIYIINIVLVIFFGVLNVSFNFMNKKITVAIIGLQLFLLLSLRDQTVGTDLYTYLKYFESINVYGILPYTNIFEFGYLLFNRLISLFTSNKQIFISIVAFITTISISRFIYKYSKLPFLSFFLYISLGFYSFTFSGLRQSIAFSILLFSYEYIKSRNFVKFIFIVFLASTFHTSAIIFILAYFVSNISINSKSILLYFLVSIFFFIFRFRIMSLITKYFYNNYSIYESGAYTILFVMIAVVTFTLLFFARTKKYDDDSVINYNLVLFSLVLVTLASTSSNVMRIVNYYYYYIIILIPDVIISFNNRKEILFASYITLVLSFFQYIYLLPKSYLGLIPYQFFWK